MDVLQATGAVGSRYLQDTYLKGSRLKKWLLLTLRGEISHQVLHSLLEYNSILRIVIRPPPLNCLAQVTITNCDLLRLFRLSATETRDGRLVNIIII